MTIRTVAVVILSSAALPAALVAQRPQVTVELTGAGRPPPQAQVALRGLLDDGRFVRAMESGFPLYVEFTVELRESKSFWDRGVARDEWEYVVLFDPVRERFVLEDADGTEIIPDRDRLGRRLEQEYAVVGLEPDGGGTFYYEAAVTARTLDDADVDEVFAWLKGENVEDGTRNRPGVLTRVARRVLVAVIPLPRVTLEARSPLFVHP